MKKHVMTFLKDEEGLTAVEYAVAAALVAGGLVAAFTALGGKISQVLNGLTSILKVPS
jgi:pilus assembly protein Flp/PilA